MVECNSLHKGIDSLAIRHLVNDLTDESQMASFLMAIPGSFDAEWGTDVWKEVFNIPTASPPDTCVKRATAK